MYLYDNMQKFVTLDKYNEQKGSPYITATNYIDRQQKQQYKKFTLWRKTETLRSESKFSDYIPYLRCNTMALAEGILSEYFYRKPRVLAINDKIKTIAMGCTDIGDPENNNNSVLFFLKISLFLGMTSTSCYFLYFYRKYKH